MVRIWSVPVSELGRQRLLGEHAELHCIVGALLGKYKAYQNHPETLRFKERIEQLYYRHTEQLKEMEKRGYCHHSQLPQSNHPFTYSKEEYERDHAELLQRQKESQHKSSQKKTTV